MTSSRSRGHDYAAREVIVSTSHLDLVVQMLHALGAPPVREPERAAALGLARVTLADLRRGLGSILGGTPALPIEQGRATALATEDARRLLVEVGPGLSDLDLLLHFVRRWFAEAYGGWTPMLGKNRYLVGIGAPDDRGDPFGAVAGPGRTARRGGPPATRVLGGPGATGEVWEVANTLADLADSGVAVLNFALGCLTRDGQPPLALARAIDLVTPAVVVLAAAGDHGAAPDPGVRQAPVWPAALPGVVAVGAHTADGTPAPSTPALPWVDLTAATVLGTAAATAHVTDVVTRDGVAAREAVQDLLDLKPGDECCGVRRFFLAS